MILRGSLLENRSGMIMTLVVITLIIVYFILIAWTWQSLGSIEKMKKIAFILIGMILLYGITLVIFQTTKGEIDYQNLEMKNHVQSILVTIFTGMNGIIVLPQLGKILDKIKEEEIEKEKLFKRLFILMIVFVLCVIIERGYMRDTQEGILKIYYAIRK